MRSNFRGGPYPHAWRRANPPAPFFGGGESRRAAVPSALREAFAARLRESGLTANDARRLGLDLLAADDVAALAPNFQRRGGFVIPYYDVRGREVLGLFRLRYVEKGVGFASHVVSPRRYAQPRGTPPKAYLPRTIEWAAIAEDPTQGIVITEGELKAACLTKHGYRALALGGVDAWRSRRRMMEFLPELEAFQWIGRDVFLCFDSDIREKREVRRALHGLARELIQRGGNVREIELPTLADLPKTGADDYLVREGVDAFAKLVEAAAPAIVVDEANLDATTFVDWANERMAVVSLGGSVRILEEGTDPESGLPTETFRRKEDAMLLHANRFYADANNAPRAVLPAWFTHPKRRTYDGVVFAPEGVENLRAREGRRFYNLWKGFRVEPEPGDWSAFDEHLRVNVCRGDVGLYRWLIAWMAHIVQRPWEKTGVAVVLRGLRGTGKSKVGERLGGLFHPDHYLAVAQERHLLGNFNSHMQGKILIQGEESFWAGDKKAEGILKDMITGERSRLELKNVDVTTIRNLVNLLITSNESWVVPAALDERRFAVFEVGEARMQDRDFFGRIDREFEAGGAGGFLFDLLSLDLAAYPDPRRAPRTPGLADQKLQNLDALGRFWFECLVSGRIGDVGSLEQWPDDLAVDVFTRRYQNWRADHRVKRPGPTDGPHIGRELRKVCPGLGTGRATRANNRGERPYEFRFPPLAECRREFERAIGGGIDWESGEVRI
jgi:hypothetical protein